MGIHMIGIIGAMSVEIEEIEKGIMNKQKTVISGIAFITGIYHGQDIVAAICGMGKVYAAMCAQTMILKFSPSIIINVGVAGALSKNLKIGDIAIADDVVQHDLDTSPLGNPVGMITGIDIVKIPCHRETAGLLKKCVDKLGIRSECGTIASGDQFLNDDGNKNLVIGRFGAIACEMEGASIGQVCYLNKVGFAVIRAISDGADGDSHTDFSQFLIQAVENSSKVIDMFFADLK